MLRGLWIEYEARMAGGDVESQYSIEWHRRELRRGILKKEYRCAYRLPIYSLVPEQERALMNLSLHISQLKAGKRYVKFNTLYAE